MGGTAQTTLVANNPGSYGVGPHIILTYTVGSGSPPEPQGAVCDGLQPGLLENPGFDTCLGTYSDSQVAGGRPGDGRRGRCIKRDDMTVQANWIPSGANPSAYACYDYTGWQQPPCVPYRPNGDTSTGIHNMMCVSSQERAATIAHGNFCGPDSLNQGWYADLVYNWDLKNCFNGSERNIAECNNGINGWPGCPGANPD